MTPGLVLLLGLAVGLSGCTRTLEQRAARVERQKFLAYCDEGGRVSDRRCPPVNRGRVLIDPVLVCERRGVRDDKRDCYYVEREQLMREMRRVLGGS